MVKNFASRSCDEAETSRLDDDESTTFVGSNWLYWLLVLLVGGSIDDGVVALFLLATLSVHVQNFNYSTSSRPTDRPPKPAPLHVFQKFCERFVLTNL